VSVHSKRKLTPGGGIGFACNGEMPARILPDKDSVPTDPGLSSPVTEPRPREEIGHVKRLQPLDPFVPLGEMATDTLPNQDQSDVDDLMAAKIKRIMELNGGLGEFFDLLSRSRQGESTKCSTQRNVIESRMHEFVNRLPAERAYH
jgi:hypothetical protein